MSTNDEADDLNATVRPASMLGTVARFCAKSYLFDLAPAFFCGLIVGALFCVARGEGEGPPPLSACAKDFFITFASYGGVALFWRYAVSQRLRRTIPSWVIVAIFGSWVCWAYSFASTSTTMWKALPYAKPPITSFIYAEIISMSKLSILFSFLTLPLSALVYYVRYIPSLIIRMRDQE